MSIFNDSFQLPPVNTNDSFHFFSGESLNMTQEILNLDDNPPLLNMNVMDCEPDTVPSDNSSSQQEYDFGSQSEASTSGMSSGLSQMDSDFESGTEGESSTDQSLNDSMLSIQSLDSEFLYDQIMTHGNSAGQSSGDVAFFDQSTDSNSQVGGSSLTNMTIPRVPIRDINIPLELPRIQNVVATANLGIKPNLEKVFSKTIVTTYDPQRFVAAILRFTTPSSTILMFETGKIVITGASGLAESVFAARKCAHLLRSLNYPARVSSYKVQNMVASCGTGFDIKIEDLVEPYQKFTSYNPESFPGLIFRLDEPKVTLLIFVSGKVVITGGNNEETIHRAFMKIYPILVKHRRTGVVQ